MIQTRPEPLKAPPAGSWTTYKRLLKYVKPFWFAFFLAVFGNIVYAAASTGMAAAMEYVITAIENPSDQNRMLLTGLIVGVFAFRGVGTFFSQYFISYVGRNVINALRNDVFDRLMSLPSRYYDENASGHLVSKLTFNVEQVAEAATNSVTITLREGLTILGLLGFMLYTNWKLTLLFLDHRAPSSQVWSATPASASARSAGGSRGRWGISPT